MEDDFREEVEYLLNEELLLEAIESVKQLKYMATCDKLRILKIL